MTAPSPIRRMFGRTKTSIRALAQSARSASSAPQAFRPGAFYSPVPNAGELLGAERARIWPGDPPDPTGVAIDSNLQRRVLSALAQHAAPTWSAADGSYDPLNDQFPPQDAAVLYAMVRTIRPRRMVEVGCGWSTTVTAQAIRDGALDVELTCIEPYPRDFLTTLDEITNLHRQRIEHAALTHFTALGRGDILFIDTSHVAKTGSDVVHIVLEVLPRLADGVIVHLHDIFFPFDYPDSWIGAGFGWNEQYIVQAFLSGNSRITMLAMNRWLAARMPDELAEHGFPTQHGSSIWFAVGSLPPPFEPSC